MQDNSQLQYTFVPFEGAEKVRLIGHVVPQQQGRIVHYLFLNQKLVLGHQSTTIFCLLSGPETLADLKLNIRQNENKQIWNRAVSWCWKKTRRKLWKPHPNSIFRKTIQDSSNPSVSSSVAWRYSCLLSEASLGSNAKRRVHIRHIANALYVYLHLT